MSGSVRILDVSQGIWAFLGRFWAHAMSGSAEPGLECAEPGLECGEPGLECGEHRSPHLVGIWPKVWRFHKNFFSMKKFCAWLGPPSVLAS